MTQRRAARCPTSISGGASARAVPAVARAGINGKFMQVPLYNRNAAAMCLERSAEFSGDAFTPSA